MTRPVVAEAAWWTAWIGSLLAPGALVLWLGLGNLLPIEVAGALGVATLCALCGPAVWLARIVEKEQV